MGRLIRLGIFLGLLWVLWVAIANPHSSTGQFVQPLLPALAIAAFVMAILSGKSPSVSSV